MSRKITHNPAAELTVSEGFLVLHSRLKHPWVPTPYGEYSRLHTGSAVIANRTVDAEEIGIARCGRMPSFDAVDASACDHLAFAIENQIDLFFALVMMREI